MNELIKAILGGVGVQLLLTIITVAMLKADMKWIKKGMTDHEKRLRSIERHSPHEADIIRLRELGV